jgi:hypothetical protein
MAMRVATMTSTDNSSTTRKTGQLSRKLVLLFLLTSAYALGLVLLLYQRLDFPLILFTFFADCTLALAAGFGARFILSKRNRFIRSTAAIIMVLAGLAILGYFSQWEIGLDVPQLMRGYVSWMDLSHLGLGTLAALSAVWAWRRSKPAHQVVEVPVRAPVVPARSNSTHSFRPRIRLPQNWSLNMRDVPSLRSRSSSGNGRWSSGRVRPKLISGQSVRVKRRKANHRQAHVQLALVEEHRCPYCLEPVLRTDPRGVKECEICHSLHHADCWAITGTCQVPHLN